MPTTTLRVQSASVATKNGVQRLILILENLDENIDYEEEIQEGEDLSIELPSTTPPV